MAVDVDDPLKKSAILMLALGEEEAAEVFKHMNAKEAQKLGSAMAAVGASNKETIAAVLQEFCDVAKERTSLGLASDDYIRAVLNKALGTDKAASLLERILKGGDTSGIESLKFMEGGAVSELIKNEHPQIIATILVYLEPDQVSEIIKFFPERLRNDVMLRIATLDGVQPAALADLNDVLTKLLSGSKNLQRTVMGGVKTAAEILNFLGTQLETTVISSVRDYDPDLAQKIQDEMFVFENLLDVDDRGIQLLLREVQSESLVIALKGATEDLREKVFKNMSARAAEMMRDDLESKGPVRLSEVEVEQKAILQVTRRLADEGQLVIGGKGEDSYV